MEKLRSVEVGRKGGREEGRKKGIVEAWLAGNEGGKDWKNESEENGENRKQGTKKKNVAQC